MNYILICFSSSKERGGRDGGREREYVFSVRRESRSLAEGEYVTYEAFCLISAADTAATVPAVNSLTAATVPAVNSLHFS